MWLAYLFQMLTISEAGTLFSHIKLRAGNQKRISLQVRGRGEKGVTWMKLGDSPTLSNIALQIPANLYLTILSHNMSPIWKLQQLEFEMTSYINNSRNDELHMCCLGYWGIQKFRVDIIFLTVASFKDQKCLVKMT